IRICLPMPRRCHVERSRSRGFGTVPMGRETPAKSSFNPHTTQSKTTPTTPRFHYSTTPLSHYSIIPLFHYSITPLFHYSIIPLSHYSIIPLFHYSTPPSILGPSFNFLPPNLQLCHT